MIEKQKIDTYLVANKKRAQQAQILCIRKIVKKIKKLEELSKKHPENTKTTEKLRKNELILLALKKKKSDHINLMRKIVAYEKNPEAVITGGNSSPEEIADALLATQHEIKEIVSEAKSKFFLNEESNPGWKEEITAATKKTLKTERLKRKREKRAERKQTSAKEKQRLDWLNQNNVGTPLEPIGEKEQANNDDVEEEASITTQKKHAGLSKKLKLQKEKESNDNAYEESYDGINLSNKEKNQVDSVSESTAEEKIVDPFFTTSSGELYKATAVKERIQSDVKNDGLIWRESKSNPPKNSLQLKNKKYQGKKTLDGSADRKSELNEKMHPSWSAKQKQKGIDGFTGKRIKFDDNEESQENKSDITSNSGSNLTQNSKEKLHPSWVAKQKLKPVITASLGKKIYFDDN